MDWGGWMDGCKDGRMNQSIDGSMDWWLDGWKDGLVSEDKCYKKKSQ